MDSAKFRKIVLWISVGWGVVMLGVGCVASFTIGANDTILTLTVFALLFVLPLAASIAAWRMAGVAGIALLLSAVAVPLCISKSWADVLQIASRIYLWLPHILFGLLFLAISRTHVRSIDRLES